MRRLDYIPSQFSVAISPTVEQALAALPGKIHQHVHNELNEMARRAPAIAVGLSLGGYGVSKLVTFTVDGYIGLCRIEPLLRRVTLTDVASWLD